MSDNSNADTQRKPTTDELEGVTGPIKELQQLFDVGRRLGAVDVMDLDIAFAADERVEIPPVVFERTRPNVITTAWADGRDFYEFARTASDSERCAAGLILIEFAYRSFFQLGIVNADPHPGNYIFPESFSSSGPVIFIDFGCTRRFDPAYVEGERELMRVVIEDRRMDFRDALLATGLIAQPRGFDFDLHLRSFIGIAIRLVLWRAHFERARIALRAGGNRHHLELDLPARQLLLVGLHALRRRGFGGVGE